MPVALLIDEPVVLLDDGDVLDEEALPVVSAADDELLPVVPDVLLVLPAPYDDPLAEPIIALVSVNAPVEPCRHPVRVMDFDALVLLWSQLPDVPVVLGDVVPVVLGDEVDGSCVGVALLPDCVPLVDPDCAARVTANAQAMAKLDAVVTTRFMS